jgi:large subunit ribosomal protein L29
MNRAKMINELTTAELKVKYTELKSELFALRFQHTVGQLKNPLLLKTTKKDIARVLTELTKRGEKEPASITTKVKFETVKAEKKVKEKKEVKEVKEEPTEKKPVKKVVKVAKDETKVEEKKAEAETNENKESE